MVRYCVQMLIGGIIVCAGRDLQNDTTEFSTAYWGWGVVFGIGCSLIADAGMRLERRKNNRP